MKKLLWIGDAGCPSGFARATHEILDVMRQSFDVTVLGINYRGDPHPYPYPIYAAAVGGDMFGVGRMIWMCDLIKPDVIVLQNDPWNVPAYTGQLKRFPEYKDLPVVASMAVDGLNCEIPRLNDLALGIFWTQFGCDEARYGGFSKDATVIPLGVSLTDYYPVTRADARQRLPDRLHNAFIVGNVNRNQPRKRLDLTIRYFAEWVKSKNIPNAFLYLHVAPTGDTGTDLIQLARYYDVTDNVLTMQPATWYGVSEDDMRMTYNCFDVQISTTQGEGFGLTTFEGMACGVPQIVPDWSALGELVKGAARLVPCTSTAIGPPYVNVIGGIPDEAQFIQALDDVYRKPEVRRQLIADGFDRVSEPRFRWEEIGRAFTDAVKEVV